MRNTIMNFVKSAGEKVKDTTIKAIHKMEANNESYSIDEIASFILNHPQSSVHFNDYLKLKFTNYYLQLNGLTFEMLIRGAKNQKVLELNITANHGENILQYRSYHKSPKRINLPISALK